MKILLIRPIVSNVSDETILDRVRQFVAADVTIDAVHLTEGPYSIECSQDVMLAQPGIVKAALRAEKAGYDGCVINCFADPAMEIAREMCHIPIVGPGISSMLLSRSIGQHPGIITLSTSMLEYLHIRSRDYGIEIPRNAIRSVDVGLQSFGDVPLAKMIAEEGKKLAREENIDSLILGCTGMCGLDREVEAIMAATGSFVPVIDPSGAAIGLLQSMIRLNVSCSPVTYGRSPKPCQIEF